MIFLKVVTQKLQRNQYFIELKEKKNSKIFGPMTQYLKKPFGNRIVHYLNAV